MSMTLTVSAISTGFMLMRLLLLLAATRVDGDGHDQDQDNNGTQLSVGIQQTPSPKPDNGPYIDYKGFTRDQVEEIIAQFASVAAQPGMPGKDDKTWFRTLAAGIEHFVGQMLKQLEHSRFDLAMCNEKAETRCSLALLQYDGYYLRIANEPRIFNVNFALCAFQSVATKSSQLRDDPQPTAETFHLNVSQENRRPIHKNRPLAADQYCLTCQEGMREKDCNVIRALIVGTLMQSQVYDAVEVYHAVEYLNMFTFGNVALAIWEWDPVAPNIAPYDVYFRFEMAMITHCANWSTILPDRNGFLVVSDMLMDTKSNSIAA